MAHLQKLSIQGVRSFDPDTCQEIKFFPLTLILGPNGAGKTTVIESLKYAATGNLPPNCNMGRSFVHDVLFANQATIRGQIRLRFTDVENKSTVITRSMQTTCRKSKTSSNPSITFKQMNQVIKREGKSIDQKCADINNEVIELIGVSKALLNNVIFCHQEETNWPLSEGKVLKEKFDDIFGSIGYVKILEKIKKTRDEEVKKFKLLEKDVRYFEHLKKEAENTRKELNEDRALMDIEKAKVKEFESKIKVVKEKLDELNDKEVDAQDINNSISTIEGTIAEQRKSAEYIKRKINPSILSKSESEVDEELKNFDDNLKLQLDKKVELKDKLKNSEIEKTQQNQVQISFLNKLKEDNKEKLAKLFFEVKINPNNIRETFYKLSTKVSQEKSLISNNVSSIEKKLDLNKFKIESKQQLLSQRIKDLDLNKSKFDGICNFDNFEAYLQEKESELIQLRDEKTKHAGLIPVVNSQVETLSKCDMCPVCENDLSSVWTSKKTAQSVDKQSLVESLKKSTLACTEEVKRLDEKIQAAEQMCAKLRKLRTNYDAIQGITSHILAIKSEMPSLKERVDPLEKELEAARANLTTVQGIHDAIQERLLLINSEWGDIEKKQKSLTSELAAVEKEIFALESRNRSIGEYKQLMNLQKEIREKQEQLNEERRKLNSMNFNSIKEASERTNAELATIKAKVTFAKQRIGEIDERISKQTAKLSGNYESAEKNYKEKLLEMIVTEVATGDLNKYYKALDYSISSFHKCKMEEINKLLKSFWEIAYQGKDIDYILIASDEEERSASDKRRTYNYRVVMMKKGKEMDMKGRCSAGQKVLASLIIRLALAVIFCRNFAVLTLDEPTTNLDKANIHSFARAIVSLIRSNRNFQIVIITHDEQFLECFDGALGEYYYKVSKDDHGYSVITRKPIVENSQNIPQVPQPDDSMANETTDGNSNKRNNEVDGDVTLELAPKRVRKD